MVSLQNVSMHYPVPRRYIELLTKPFISKRYIALNSINLEIQTGDRVAILGHNGAGKTTLLKLIGGLLIPSIGNIEVNNRNTKKENLNARKSVGFVLNEERSFYWRLTGIENLKFFGQLDNINGDRLNIKINEVLELVGLNNSAVNKRFAEFSSGMKQRLAIARGIMCEPDILILDEPTRTLDPISAVDIKNIILRKLHNKNKTLLIATHRLDEAVDLCNKICIMKEGKVLLYDSYSNVIKKYKNMDSCYKIIMNSK